MWIKKNNSKTIVVFIHGVLTDEKNAWRDKHANYWPDILKHSFENNSLDIFVYSYHTSILSGNYSIGDICDDLFEEICIQEIDKYENIIFVCHSMGGIIARQLLVDREREFVKLNIRIGLFLVASPSIGSFYANWLIFFIRFLNHSQAEILRFHRANYKLNDLDRRFINLKEKSDLEIHGKELIEDEPLFFRPIVSSFSAGRYFANPLKIAKSNHGSIATPSSSSDKQHLILCKFIKDFMIDNSKSDVDSDLTIKEKILTEKVARNLLKFDRTYKGDKLLVSNNRLTSCKWISSDFLVTGGFSGELIFYRISQRKIQNFKITNSIIRCLFVDKINSIIIIGDDEGEIHCFDLENQTFSSLKSSNSSVFDISKNPITNNLLTSHRNGDVIEWDLDEKKKELHTIRTLHSHNGPSFKILFNKDNNTCYSVGADGRIISTNFTTGKRTETSVTNSSLFAVRKAANEMFVGDSSGRIFEIENEKSKNIELNGHNDAIRTMVTSSNGEWLVTASKDGTVRLWNLISNRGWILIKSKDYFYDLDIMGDDCILSCNGLGEIFIINLPGKLEHLSASGIDYWIELS